MRTLQIKFIVVLFVLTSGTPVFCSMIEANSTATLVTEPGQYQGWYLYEFNVLWDLNKGLSHWDLILKPECSASDHHIEFDTPSGYSNSEDYSEDPFALSWNGFFEPKGDPSMRPKITAPIVKYEPVENGDEPGKQGAGSFYFYANIIPETGSYIDKIAAKAGQANIYGNLEGDYPSCTVIPEPFSLMTMIIGSMIFGLKRHR